MTGLLLCAVFGAACGPARPARAEGGVAAAVGDSEAPVPAQPGVASAETLFARAESAFGHGEAERALEYYRQVPSASPLVGPALVGEGRCLVALNQVDLAIRTFRQALDRPDTSAAGRTAAATATDCLGRIYLDLGRTELARKAFHELAERAPERRDYAGVMAARSYRDDGAWFAAYAALKPVLQRGRSNQAYDLALDIYWHLDARAQRELSRLMKSHLSNGNREVTDNRSP